MLYMKSRGDNKLKVEIKKLENINMLNDAMFKAVFRSVEARKMVATFLSRITGIEESILEKAEYQGGELVKNNIKEKGKVSDIIVKIQDDNKIILEMNQFVSNYIFEKNMSYAFTMFAETIPLRAKRYPYVYLINLDNFNKFKTKEGILHFKIRDEYGHIETEHYQSIHLILENIIDEKYNGDKEIKKTVEFLKKNNLEEMKKEYGSDEKYMAAVRRVEDLSTDPNFIGYYDEKEAIQQDLDDMWETGYDEGEKKGLEQGLTQGLKQGMKQGLERGAHEKQIEIAKNLIKKLDIKEVSEITGLSIEEVKKLS